MSLNSIVHGGLAGRLHLRRGAAVATIQPRAVDVAVDSSIGSMRGLETILALTAIATAILIGLGR